MQDIVATLLAQINAARATGAIERKLQTLVRIPLIIIDDFGLKPLKATQDEDFHGLVAERYERAATIVTSNRDIRVNGDIAEYARNTGDFLLTGHVRSYTNLVAMYDKLSA